MILTKQTKGHLLELRNSEWRKILQTALQGAIEATRDELEKEEDDRKVMNLQGKIKAQREFLDTPEQLINKISTIEAQQLNQEDSE